MRSGSNVYSVPPVLCEGGITTYPIPASALIHSAALQQAAKDANQDLTYTTIAELTRVRMEPSARQVLTKDGAQKQLTMTMFFDARNSQPTGAAFEAGQYVLFNGIHYRIEAVDPLYDGRKLHHYEVGLSG